MRVCARACVSVRLRACVRAFVRACVCVCVGGGGGWMQVWVQPSAGHIHTAQTEPDNHHTFTKRPATPVPDIFRK